MRRGTWGEWYPLSRNVVPSLQAKRRINPEDNLKVIQLLVILILFTMLFIVVILFLKYRESLRKPAIPQILLGDFIESRETFVYSCFLQTWFWLFKRCSRWVLQWNGGEWMIGLLWRVELAVDEAWDSKMIEKRGNINGLSDRMEFNAAWSRWGFYRWEFHS